MGSNFLCKTVLLACALSALAYGKGKLVAEHVISSSNGFYNSAPGGWAWTPDFAADDKGNLCQFFFTRGADSNVTELAYEARDKKGKIYSQGTLPEAVGASTVYIPTGVSTGNGGFSKRLLLLGYFKSMNVEYVLYKLGKNGAQKLGEKAVGTSTMFRQAFLYKGKVGIMVQDTIVAAEANGTSQTDRVAWVVKSHVRAGPRSLARNASQLACSRTSSRRQ